MNNIKALKKFIEYNAIDFEAKKVKFKWLIPSNLKLSKDDEEYIGDLISAKTGYMIVATVKKKYIHFYNITLAEKKKKYKIYHMNWTD